MHHQESICKSCPHASRDCLETRTRLRRFRHWPPAQVFWYPGAEDEPSEDYNTNGFTVYPDDPALRLMFPAIYRHCSDDLRIRLAVSRDNRAWNWVSRRAVLGPGRFGSGTAAAFTRGRGVGTPAVEGPQPTRFMEGQARSAARPLERGQGLWVLGPQR